MLTALTGGATGATALLVVAAALDRDSVMPNRNPPHASTPSVEPMATARSNSGATPDSHRGLPAGRSFAQLRPPEEEDTRGVAAGFTTGKGTVFVPSAACAARAHGLVASLDAVAFTIGRTTFAGGRMAAGAAATTSSSRCCGRGGGVFATTGRATIAGGGTAGREALISSSGSGAGSGGGAVIMRGGIGFAALSGPFSSAPGRVLWLCP